MGPPARAATVVGGLTLPAPAAWAGLATTSAARAGQALWRWLGDEEGTATVEYALLVCAVALATAEAWVALMEKIRDVLVTATGALSAPPQ